MLYHLGIKLYSNIPAVLSEVVANAWDADAEKVKINILEDKIVIQDDGEGMTVEDANSKYLCVGYDRREDRGGRITKKHKRPVMGRKGIGKLSLFSIADTIEVQTAKDGQSHGFVMSAQAIEDKISKKGVEKDTYYPEPLPQKAITVRGHGTQITLTNLKKSETHSRDALRKRIARRFSIIGSEYHFSVEVDDVPIKITDRDYFHKLQYIWYFGKESEKYKRYCNVSKLKHSEQRLSEVEVNGGEKYRIKGWIGTVENAGDLQDGSDNLNKIILMARGKLAQEDILEDFAEGGMYTKYLIGEIEADFLDMDNKEDIATSSRQEIIKADPRYQALKDWVREQLKNIQGSWTQLRNESGTNKALEIPAINNWFASLGKDNKTRAKSLFGKINQITVDSDAQRKELFKHGVLAFESYRYKENLDALDKVTPENMQAFVEIFANLDDIEATLYHQIVKERLEVIETLKQKTEGDALEKLIQKHLYDHLWLLDPSWDRATETPHLEQQVKKEFDKINAKLSQDEKAGRVDIRYKKTTGKHVIVELKRASRILSSWELGEQVVKYYNALEKLLEQSGKGDEPIEVICLVGKPLKDWNTPKKKEEAKRALT